MRKIVLFLALIVGVVMLTQPGPSLGEVFENRDTAENRQDVTFGTRNPTGTPYIQNDPETGDESMGYIPRDDREERDWYDEVIITVSPDVGYGTQTTSTSTTSNSTSGQNGTTTSTTTTSNQ